MLKNGKGLLITFVFVSAVTCLGLAAASGVFAQATAAEETRVFECRDRPKDLATPPRRNPAGPKNPNGKETTVEASGAARAKPLCPDGQLPFPRDLKAPKGNPYFSGTGVDAPYNYAGAWASAGGSIPLFDGGGVVTILENPAISTAASIHSLFEIAVQGGTGNGDIVEIGWRKRSGDASPRLFVFHWEDWNPGCYNGCGWVQWNPSIVPGMVVNAGTESYMGWVYYEGNWWAWYANQWVGYFPETLWADGYNKANLVQLRATLAAAARFWYPCKVDAAAWVCWIDSTPSLTTLSVPWYTVQNVGGSAHRFGGPGGRAGAGVDP